MDILLVEDNEDTQLIISTFLKKTPHSLTIAVNGTRGVETFKQNPFDLVLMDIKMPIKDGIAATREIRNLEKENGRVPIPIIALTAHAFTDEIQRCIDAGCTTFLTKPFKRDTFLGKIKGYLPS